LGFCRPINRQINFAVGEEVDLIDSEGDADSKPTEGANIGRAKFAQEYGTKPLTVRGTKHSDTDENLANNNSDTEGSSETCESETKFREGNNTISLVQKNNMKELLLIILNLIRNLLNLRKHLKLNMKH
jgi:hypothetical protein